MHRLMLSILSNFKAMKMLLLLALAEQKDKCCPFKKGLNYFDSDMLYKIPIKMVQFPPYETWSSFTLSQASVKAVKAFVDSMW